MVGQSSWTRTQLFGSSMMFLSPMHFSRQPQLFSFLTSPPLILVKKVKSRQNNERAKLDEVKNDRSEIRTSDLVLCRPTCQPLHYKTLVSVTILRVYKISIACLTNQPTNQSVCLSDFKFQGFYIHAVYNSGKDSSRDDYLLLMAWYNL